MSDAPARTEPSAAPGRAPLPAQRCSAAGMADGRRVWDVPFDRLPDEVMINIFSYFSFNELIDTLQNVCVRWKRLAHVPALWLDKEYAVRGRRWKLQGRTCCGVVFSECMHCKCDKTDEQVLKSVGTMPQLRRLTIMRAIRGSVLRKICADCPNITNLQIQSSQKLKYSTVKYIFEKCPKIQKLQLPDSTLADRQCVRLLSDLKHLSCLLVCEGRHSTVPVRLRYLADACPQLKEVHTNLCYYDIHDLEYFMKRVKRSLVSTTLRWASGLEVKWSLVVLLKQCEVPLQKLRLVGYNHMPPELETAAFEALGGLHTLHELDAEMIRTDQPKVISLAFRPGCLTQLRRLQLRYVSSLRDETMITISRGCPNLRELRIRKAEEITDEALSEIHLLKHLEILDLSGCNGLGGTAMAYIAQLPALHTLVLQALHDLSKLQPSLRQIVDLKELRCLDIFNSRNVSAVPFGEFPGRLVKLRELRVAYDGREKEVFDELQRNVPYLKILKTFRYTEVDLSDDIEMADGEGEDEYYFGDDYYYGDSGSEGEGGDE